MNKYKKVSLPQLKGQDFGTWELKNIIDDKDTPNLSAVVIVHKGNKPELHHSDLSDRVYYVIKGDGQFHFKDEVVEVEEGDLIYIPKNVSYCSVGKNVFTCLSILSPAFSPEHEITN